MEFYSILVIFSISLSIYYAHVVGDICNTGELLPHESDCPLFYQCAWGGEKVEMHCSGDLVFNTDKNVCDWQQDAEDPCNHGDDDNDGCETDDGESSESGGETDDGDSSDSDLKPFTGTHSTIYSTKFSTCTEFTRQATQDCRWKANFDRRIDEILLQGTIVAYQIQWFNGDWSDWYSPSHNYIDHKMNPSGEPCVIPIYAKSHRRMRAYLYDHTHRYVICK